MNNINRIVINTGLPGFVLIDRITEAKTENICGMKDFADAPVYLGIESLAQLGAYHVRFLTQFERHAFLLKITRCKMPEEEVLNGRYLLYGTLTHRSKSAFAYKLQTKKENETNPPLPPLPPFNKGGMGGLCPLPKGDEKGFYLLEKEGLPDETCIEGEFLYATVDYSSAFKKEILQDHYRKVFSCLQNDTKTD